MLFGVPLFNPRASTKDKLLFLLIYFMGVLLKRDMPNFLGDYDYESLDKLDPNYNI